jgi:predicted component of type VI protein secretion system
MSYYSTTQTKQLNYNTKNWKKKYTLKHQNSPLGSKARKPLTKKKQENLVLEVYGICIFI